MAYIVERTVWNPSRKHRILYLVKHLVEHGPTGLGFVCYLGMAGKSSPKEDIFSYFGEEDLKNYFSKLEQKERIRRMLEFWLYFNSIRNPLERSTRLIERSPFKKLVMKKRLKAENIANLAGILRRCGWEEVGFYEHLKQALPYLWNKVGLRGKKSMRLEEFRKVVGR